MKLLWSEWIFRFKAKHAASPKISCNWNWATLYISRFCNLNANPGFHIFTFLGKGSDCVIFYFLVEYRPSDILCKLYHYTEWSKHKMMCEASFVQFILFSTFTLTLNRTFVQILYCLWNSILWRIFKSSSAHFTTKCFPKIEIHPKKRMNCDISDPKYGTSGISIHRFGILLITYSFLCYPCFTWL